ncbi:agmatinase [uncultured Croceitalea sp.]|uniref:agmatinase n=1 Tax=uncultured Croceitalea sp. TaxID=1798908 RepID=UPI0033058C81
MSKVGLQGFLFDEKSSFLKGPRLAPPCIREAYHSASANYFAENGEAILPKNITDYGDFSIENYLDIETITLKNLNKDLPLLSLGGDHSITYPIIKAFHSVYGKVDILHIDAHSDLYSNFEGDPYSHACPFYNIMNNGLAANLHQVGIRTLNKTQRDHAAQFQVDINEMKDFHKFSMPKFENPLYLSLDLDGLDPAFAPGVSHHEPGGLSTREVMTLIQHIDVPIVGADIVEYNPAKDIHEMTAMLAAKLLKEIVSKMI